MDYKDYIFVSGDSLYGLHGGQLEIVSIEFQNEVVNGQVVKLVVITFTDHDVQIKEDAPVDGVYYKLRFPIHNL